MKRTLVCALAVLMMSSMVLFAKGKDKDDKSASVDQKLTAIEKSLWEAWKNKDGKAFEDALSSDTVDVESNGMMDKAGLVSYISSSKCDVKDYSLSDTKVQMLDKDSALLTYKATQHATCDGKPSPENILASSIYMKRNGKWLEVFHQETPAAQ